MTPLALLVALVCATETGRAGGVDVYPARDNTLFQDAQGDTSNGAGPAIFAGVNGQGLIHRALLRFDVANAVPAGSVIDSVVLWLEVSSAPDTVTRLFALHRVVSEWGEGTSYSAGGSGAPASSGDATWLNTFYPASFWLAPGGDFDAVTSAVTPVADVGTYAWSGPAMLADVRDWLARPTTNFGWLLQGDEVHRRSVRRFDSGESAPYGQPPVLTLFYSTPVPTRASTWGALKARFR